MPQFAANLTLLFNDRPLLERPAAAARAGFRAVEIHFPYDQPAETLRAAIAAAGLDLVQFNAPAGDWAAGQRGLAGLPGQEAACQAGFDTALAYAAVLGCPRLHLMAGIVGTQGRDAAWRAFVGNLRHAAARAAERGITVLVEPVNTRDMPGYLIDSLEAGVAAIHEAGSPNLRLQFDIYHLQILQGDIARRLREVIDLVAHVQIAGVPGRHEPDIGELNYPYLFDLLDELGYRGWVGCEYRPRGATEAGLGWLERASGAGRRRAGAG